MLIRVVRIVAVALLTMVRVAHAQPANDHLECYQVKDPLALAAVVDLASPQSASIRDARWPQRR